MVSDVGFREGRKYRILHCGCRVQRFWDWSLALKSLRLFLFRSWVLLGQKEKGGEGLEFSVQGLDCGLKLDGILIGITLL